MESNLGKTLDKIKSECIEQTKLELTKNLLDVLDIEIIAQKTEQLF